MCAHRGAHTPPRVPGPAYLFPRRKLLWLIVKNAARLGRGTGGTPAGPVGGRRGSATAPPPPWAPPAPCQAHQSIPLGIPGGSAGADPLLRGLGGDGGAVGGQEWVSQSGSEDGGGAVGVARGGHSWPGTPPDVHTHPAVRGSPGSLRWICRNMLRYQSRGLSTLWGGHIWGGEGCDSGVTPPPCAPTHRARGEGHPRLVHGPDAIVLHPAPLPPLAVLGPGRRPARWAWAGGDSPGGERGVGGHRGAGGFPLLGRPGLVPVIHWRQGEHRSGEHHSPR